MIDGLAFIIGIDRRSGEFASSAARKLSRTDIMRSHRTNKTSSDQQDCPGRPSIRLRSSELSQVKQKATFNYLRRRHRILDGDCQQGTFASRRDLYIGFVERLSRHLTRGTNAFI